MDRRDFCLGLGVLGLQVAATPMGTAFAQGGGGTVVSVSGLPEPQALFVPTGGGGANWLPSSKILERLVKVRTDATFEPVMATDWNMSPDGREFTLTLRGGMLWHDGTPVTADDVVFCINDYWATISAPAVLGALDQAEAVDESTVVVRFKQPVPEFYFLTALGSPYAHVLPRHIYEGKDFITNEANNAPIGTGPWKLQRWVRGSHIEFVRNESYWNPERPHLDQLIIRYLRDPGARAAAVEAGDAQLAVFGATSPADARRIQDSGTFDVTSAGYENGKVSMNLEINTRGEFLQDQAVRQALLHAIDRQFIVDTVYYGFAKPATGPIFSSNALYYSDDMPVFAFDPALAEKKLDEAGFPRKADNSRFPLKLVAAGWFAPNGSVGAYVKQALGDIGIPVDLTVPDAATSRKVIYADYGFDLAITNSTIPFEPVPQITRYYASDGIRPGVSFTNATRHSDPEVDRVIDQIKVEIDIENRKRLVKEFARLAAESASMVPLVELDTLNIADKALKNHSNSGYFIAETWSDLLLESG